MVKPYNSYLLEVKNCKTQISHFWSKISTPYKYVKKTNFQGLESKPPELPIPSSLEHVCHYSVCKWTNYLYVLRSLYSTFNINHIKAQTHWLWEWERDTALFRPEFYLPCHSSWDSSCRNSSNSQDHCSVYACTQRCPCLPSYFLNRCLCFWQIDTSPLAFWICIDSPCS